MNSRWRSAKEPPLAVDFDDVDDDDAAAVGKRMGLCILGVVCWADGVLCRDVWFVDTLAVLSRPLFNISRSLASNVAGLSALVVWASAAGVARAAAACANRYDWDWKHRLLVHCALTE